MLFKCSIYAYMMNIGERLCLFVVECVIPKDIFTYMHTYIYRKQIKQTVLLTALRKSSPLQFAVLGSCRDWKSLQTEILMSVKRRPFRTAVLIRPVPSRRAAGHLCLSQTAWWYYAVNKTNINDEFSTGLKL